MKNAPCAFPQPLRRDSRSQSCFNPADVADCTNRRKLSFATFLPRLELLQDECVTFPGNAFYNLPFQNSYGNRFRWTVSRFQLLAFVTCFPFVAHMLIALG